MNREDLAGQLRVLYERPVREGLSCQLERLAAYPNGVELSARLMEGEEQIGHLRRAFYQEERVSAWHQDLFVEQSHRGRGLASALSAAWEEGYRQLGVSEITLNAQSHGAAFWLSQGFTPLDPARLARDCLSKSRSVLDEESGGWLEGNGETLLAGLRENERLTPEQEAEALRICHTRPFQPGLLLELGREQAWRASNGRLLWPGRMLLAGCEYKAIKRLSAD